MEPRLPTSRKKKSVVIPGDLRELITQVLKDTFQKEIGEHELLVDGRIFAGEVLVRVGIKPEGQLAQKNVEASIDYDPKTSQAVDQIHRCIEAIGTTLGEVLKSESIEEHSPEWQPYPLGVHTVFLRASSANFALEAEADRLLGDDELDLTTVWDDELEDPSERVH